MGQFDRLTTIQRLLSTGRSVSRQSLLRDLEVSLATLKRDIAKIRDQHGWPIEWHAESDGWRLDPTAPAGEPMLGLRLTPEEALALLTMQHVLEQMDMSGMLAKQLRPLGRQLDKLARQVAPSSGSDMRRYVRIADVATRKVSLPCFQTVSTALLARKRLRITHQSRAVGVAPIPGARPPGREVSPQRLIHYRGNWYLDAWCHTRDALRSFAVDAITEAAVLPDHAAVDMPEEELDEALGKGYGIFAGQVVQWAKLRFSVERSRWVAHEVWHPEQRGAFDEAQRWVLEVPYADDRELVMDILRHVPDVEVLAPDGLQAALLKKLVLGIRTVSPGSRVESVMPDDSLLCNEKKP